jgi:endonuclease/exonuclease/phosphatase (EEP) superfamily protein YafD
VAVRTSRSSSPAEHADPPILAPGVKLAVAATRLAVLGTLLSVVSFVPVHPATLLEHFRWQLLLGSAVVSSVAVVLRQAGWADLALICTLLNLVTVAPALVGSARSGPADGVPVRLFVANVLTSNTHYDAVARAIAEARPDIVALVEVDQAWVDALAPALAGYPGRIERVGGLGNFGIALYVRGRLTGGVELLGSALPTIVATAELEAPAVPLHVIVTHPLPPMSGAAEEQQREQLGAVASRGRAITSRGALGARGAPLLVVGDLNATPWSRPFVRFLRASGLYDSRIGFGVQASFPADLAILRIPIDHVLVSAELGVRARRVGPAVGSDHLPVFVELVAPRRQP